MKRIFFSIALMLSCCIYASAQLSISCSTSNVDLVAKRCFAQGNDVYIDLVFTGNGRWENIALLANDNRTQIYDDEGNMYKGGFMGGQDFRYGISFEYDKLTNVPNCQLGLPRDVPRKVRVKITDVDEYASSFKLIRMYCEGNSTNANPFEIIIKNLPITR